MRPLFWIAAAYVLVRVIAYGVDPASTRRYHVEAAWFLFGVIGWVTAATGRRSDRPAAVSDRRPASRDRVVLLTALSAIVFACYAPSLRVGLLSDDFSLVQRAGLWTVLSTAQAEFFRPVPRGLWALVRGITQEAVWLHAINLALHAVNGYLLALVAMRIGMSFRAAAVAAVLFVTFPAHVEAVTWISGLQDLAMTCACLIYLLLTVSELPTPGRGGVGLLALLTALLSKETAVIAPGVAILLSFLTPAEVRRRTWIWLAAGLGVAAAYSLWRISVLPPPAGYDQTLTRYFGKELISRTFGTLAVPWSTSVLHAAPWLAVVSAVFALVVTTAAVFSARLDRGLLHRGTILLVWSLLAVVPVYSYFFISPSLQGSRYLYLPACGWMLFVGGTAVSAASLRPRWVAPMVWIVLAATAAAGAAGVRWHQRPWTDAAALRDRVLSDVKRLGEPMRCTAAETDVADLPDTVDGAYVFRNGFHEAAATVLSAPSSAAQESASAAPARCRFRWTDRGLVVQPSPGI